MRVMVINPPAPNNIEMVREGRCMQRMGAWGALWPPITLAYISAVLREDGFDVMLKDCIGEHVDSQKLKSLIKEFQPTLILSNSATPSIDHDLKLASFIKSVDSKVKLGYFGIHVSSLTEQCFKVDENIDYIIKGEPEYTSRDLARHLRSNKSPKNVAGASVRINGTITHNKPRPVIADLNDLPSPAWDLAAVHNYNMPRRNKPFLLLSTSRGCPYQCTFCTAHTYYGRKLRLRDPKKVVAEMLSIKERFNIRDFLMWSEDFTLNKNYVMQICDEIIKSGVKFHWICNGRVDEVHKDMLKKMKQAGCWMIGFGIESSTQEVLDVIKKRAKVEQTKKAVAMARQAGLKTVGHFILGLPKESQKSIKRTIKFSKDIKLDYAQFYCAVPFPGSDFYTQAVNNGWVGSKDWSQFEQNFSVVNYNNLSANTVQKLRKKAYVSFYFRPKIIVNNILSIKGLDDIKAIWGWFLGFMDWIWERGRTPT